jgi:hemolysin activation/secretion protein|tara:strand:+ start:279 stop:842 length:564 start_codon:yes stop_codon:yes gene_type:complete
MATRDLTTSLTNALDDAVIEPFFAVDLLFDNSTQYIWTGVGTVTINTKNYTGLGELLEISMTQETADLSATGASLTISGIPSTTNLALALTEPYQGRRASIFFGLMSTQTTYTEVFSGYMDQMNIQEGAETSTIEITLENKLIDLERPRVARYTSQSQQQRFAGDEGFNFVEGLQDKEIVWGREVDG